MRIVRSLRNMVGHLFLVISEGGFLHLLEPVSLIFGRLKHENLFYLKEK
jgi:hypothetical protein